jgi:hypothetical protein
MEVNSSISSTNSNTMDNSKAKAASTRQSGKPIMLLKQWQNNNKRR